MPLFICLNNSYVIHLRCLTSTQRESESDSDFKLVKKLKAHHYARSDQSKSTLALREKYKSNLSTSHLASSLQRNDIKPLVIDSIADGNDTKIDNLLLEILIAKEDVDGVMHYLVEGV